MFFFDFFHLFLGELLADGCLFGSGVFEREHPLDDFGGDVLLLKGGLD